MADPSSCPHLKPRGRGGVRACLLPALLLAGMAIGDAGARSRVSARREPVSPHRHEQGLHGRVYEDRNGNGLQDSGEPGVAGAWIGLHAGGTGTAVDSAWTDAAGDYSVRWPAPHGPAPVIGVECVPASGYFPVGACVLDSLPAAPDGAPARADFRLVAFRRMRLSVRDVLCLGAGDLLERDWSGTISGGRGDLELIAGGEATGPDPLSVWFNHFPGNPLFDGARDYTRAVPNAVLALTVDTLALRTGPRRSRADLVIGTHGSAAGNLFTWITQGTPGNEGFLPSTYTQACRTRDDGDVQALATGDVAGGPGVDLLAGTRSPGRDRGSVELWTNDDAPTPTFTFAGRYPAESDSGTLGAVTALATARLDGAVTAIAGTDASGDGELVAFARDVTGPFLRVRWRQSLQGQAVRGLAVADITGDGRPDLVVGTRTGPASGALELWRNDGTAGRVAFTRIRSLPLEGIPCAVLAVDLGGTPGPDVVVGLRDNDAGRGGRAMVFFCDARTLPSRGSDPSAGRLLGWVPALVSGAFDTGVRPRGAAASPGFAAGVHPASGGGSVFVFVR